MEVLFCYSREDVISRNKHEIEKIKRHVLNPNKATSAPPSDGQDWQVGTVHVHNISCT